MTYLSDILLRVGTIDPYLSYCIKVRTHSAHWLLSSSYSRHPKRLLVSIIPIKSVLLHPGRSFSLSLLSSPVSLQFGRVHTRVNTMSTSTLMLSPPFPYFCRCSSFMPLDRPLQSDLEWLTEIVVTVGLMEIGLRIRRSFFLASGTCSRTNGSL